MAPSTKNINRAMKESTSRRITKINNNIGQMRNRVFEMNIPLQVEQILRNKIQSLSLFSGFLAMAALFSMALSPLYFIAALMAGLISAVVDFIIEYRGISKKVWDYPIQNISFKKVPFEVPLLFFNCGILATFLFYFFSFDSNNAIFFGPIAFGLSFIQILFFTAGIMLLYKYFTGSTGSIVFGALPIGIGVYLFSMEPWVLVISVIPVYMDYFIEKRLVRSAHIVYDGYGEAVATNVAMSYFPLSLFLFWMIAMFLGALKFYFAL
jgi:hypothetical protein